MPAPYDWLPLDRVTVWAAQDVTAGGQSTDTITEARDAAAGWVEGRRPDLLTDGVYTPPPMVVMGSLLLAARLLGRVASGATPTMGLAQLASRDDPDIATMLGIDMPGVG